MRAEQILAKQLSPQRARLKMGSRVLIRLRQRVLGPSGHEVRGDEHGEHVAGWLRRSQDEVVIQFDDTLAGQTARVMLEEELLDAIVGFDGTVRLVAGPEEPVTVRFADLQVQRRFD